MVTETLGKKNCQDPVLQQASGGPLHSFLRRFLSCFHLTLNSEARIGKLQAWETDRKGQIPKNASGRVHKVFWTQGAKVSEKSFAPPETAFAPVQNGVAPVQEALCSLGPTDLLHPPRSTFGNFPFSVSFPGPQLPRARKQSHQRNLFGTAHGIWTVTDGTAHLNDNK